jgi:hypothetical protein
MSELEPTQEGPPCSSLDGRTALAYFLDLAITTNSQSQRSASYCPIHSKQVLPYLPSWRRVNQKAGWVDSGAGLDASKG